MEANAVQRTAQKAEVSMTPWYDRPINRWVYSVAVPLFMLGMIAAAYLLTAGLAWWLG